MAAPEEKEEGAKKKGKGGMILIILLAVLGIGGGGAAGYLGLIPIPGLHPAGAEHGEGGAAPSAEQGGGATAHGEKLPDISSLAFVDLDRVVIPLGEQANAHHLVAKFTLETTKEYKQRIEELKPRIMSVVNTYLRAVEEKDITDPAKFQRLLALMLNRVQLVAGDAALRNILVQEFILQ